MSRNCQNQTIFSCKISC